MKRILLPQAGFEISQAVFGTSRLGGTIERYDKKEALGILRSALEAGITCFDTADIYGQGNGERLLGEAFRQRRDEVTLATKGGYVLSGKGRLLAKIKPLVRRFLKGRPGLVKAAGRARGTQMSQDFSRRHLTAAVEASLKRLGTDRIDLYQLHSPDVATLGTDEVFETLADLKQTGKIRAYGISLLDWADAPRCLDRGVAWLQVDGGLLAGRDATALCRQCETAGTAVIARQAFGSGLLSRPPESWSEADFSGGAAELAAARDRMKAISATGDPFEVMLRYLAHHAPFHGFLLATTRKDHLQANLAALSRPALSAPEVDGLSRVLPFRPEPAPFSHGN